MSCCPSNTTTLHPPAEEYHRSLQLTVLGPIATLLIALTSIVGNSAVVAVSYWYEALHMQTANLLIVYLALTDITTALFVMLPSAIAVSFDTWPFGKIFCMTNAVLNHTLFSSSSFNIALISLDRVIAVLFPFKYYRWMTNRLMIGCCVFLFSESFIIGAVFLSIHDWVVYDYRDGVCAIDYFYPNADLKTMTLYACAYHTYFPAVVMGLCNAIIIFTANRSKRCAQKVFVKRSHLANDNHMRKTIKSLLMIVLAYYVCYTPYSVTKQVKIFSGIEAPGWWDYMTQIILFVASATNPFIYGIFRKDYRDGFKKFYKLLKEKLFQF